MYDIRKKLRLKPWDNSKTELFLVDDEDAKPLLRTAIEIIEWDGKTTLRMTESDFVLGNAVVTLESFMPWGIDIFFFPKEAELHLTHNECGQLHTYYPDDVIMAFEDIIFDYRRIRHPLPFGLNEAGRIIMEVVFRCNVRMVGMGYGYSLSQSN